MLRCELNRRQRILDLVRDLTGHLAPCLQAIGSEDFRHVLSNQHFFVAVGQRNDRDPERADIAVDVQLELRGFGAALPMSSEKVAYLGMEFNIIAEQLPRCEVRRADAHLSIEYDDRSVDVLEQRLQAIPLVTQIVLLPPNRLP